MRKLHAWPSPCGCNSIGMKATMYSHTLTPNLILVLWSHRCRVNQERRPPRRNTQFRENKARESVRHSVMRASQARCASPSGVLVCVSGEKISSGTGIFFTGRLLSPGDTSAARRGATFHRPERHLRILAWKRNPPRRAGEDISVIPPSIERSMFLQRTAGARHQSSSLRSLRHGSNVSLIIGPTQLGL